MGEGTSIMHSRTGPQDHEVVGGRDLDFYVGDLWHCAYVGFGDGPDSRVLDSRRIYVTRADHPRLKNGFWQNLAEGKYDSD